MIYIVTVYKSYNYGSILQARMLYRILANYNTDIVFLDSKSRTYLDKNRFKDVLRAVLKEKNIRKACFLLGGIKQIILAWKQMRSTTTITNNTNNIIVLGSDEIWNVNRAECRYDVFFGANCKGKIFSYAPSVNNTTREQFAEYPPTSNIDFYSAISVRDLYSKTVVSGVTDKDVSVVLDPTLLFDYQIYAEEKIIKKINTHYIALYVFEPKLTSEEICAIQKFAQARNLKLISLGKWIDWCDESIPAIDGNPFLYYKGAEFVITNTFHGTAFAINFEKEFITFTRNNRKVKELIETFELPERDASGCTSEEIQEIFERKIDYERITDKKHDLRKTSIEYIHKAFSN